MPGPDELALVNSLDDDAEAGTDRMTIGDPLCLAVRSTAIVIAQEDGRADHSAISDDTALWAPLARRRGRCRRV